MALYSNLVSRQQICLSFNHEELIPWEDLKDFIDLLRIAESTSDHKKLRDIFEQTVSGYIPEKDILDVIYLEQKKLSS